MRAWTRREPDRPCEACGRPTAADVLAGLLECELRTYAATGVSNETVREMWQEITAKYSRQAVNALVYVLRMDLLRDVANVLAIRMEAEAPEPTAVEPLVEEIAPEVYRIEPR
jgi:hypothetical protein